MAARVLTSEYTYSSMLETSRRYVNPDTKIFVAEQRTRDFVGTRQLWYVLKSLLSRLVLWQLQCFCRFTLLYQF